MKHKMTILLGIGCLLLLCCNAQTADEIVNKYFTAIGGKEKIAAMKTMVSKGDMTIMNNPAPFSTYITDATGYKNEVDFNGQKIITCYLNGTGWTINPLAGIAEPSPLPADQALIGKMTYDLRGPLYDYVAKGNKLEKTNSTALKLTTSDGTEMLFSFDGTTGYLVKTVTKLIVGGNPFEITTVMSDYQKTNVGVLVPFTTETSYPGLTVTATAKTVDINSAIDPSVFMIPKK